MKRRISSLVVAFVLLLSALYLNYNTIVVSKCTVHGAAESNISKFKKFEGMLIVKIGEGGGPGLSIGNKFINKKSIKLKFSSKCKWFRSYVTNEKDYIKSSYSEVEENIEKARAMYLKDRENYSSPGSVDIIVKNNKVVRVNVIYS